MNPKISVIIPTHQRAHLIGDAIRSVLAQTVLPLEIIVVNDGGTDDTPQVVTRIAEDLSPDAPKIICLEQANAGPAAARNHGIRHASGNFIAFLDSDDTWHPEALECFSRLSATHPMADVLFARAENVDEKGNRSDYVHDRAIVDRMDWASNGPFDALEALAQANIIPMGAVLVRRSTLLAADGFAESLRLAEDYDLWLKLAVSDARFAYLNSHLLNRRMHGTNLVNDGLRLKEAACAVLERHAPKEAAPRISSLHYDLGSAYFKRRNWKLAHRHLAKVASLSLLKRPVLWAKRYFASEMASLNLDTSPSPTP